VPRSPTPDQRTRSGVVELALGHGERRSAAPPRWCRRARCDLPRSRSAAGTTAFASPSETARPRRSWPDVKASSLASVDPRRWRRQPRVPKSSSGALGEDGGETGAVRATDHVGGERTGRASADADARRPWRPRGLGSVHGRTTSPARACRRDGCLGARRPGAAAQVAPAQKSPRRGNTTARLPEKANSGRRHEGTHMSPVHAFFGARPVDGHRRESRSAPLLRTDRTSASFGGRQRLFLSSVPSASPRATPQAFDRTQILTSWAGAGAWLT